MISTTHEMPLAIESSVSPWKSEACARDGSARNARAMNETKRPLRRRRRPSMGSMNESCRFTVPYCPKTGRLGRKMIAAIPVKTYWTFVVRAILRVSRFQPDRPTKETSGAENEQQGSDLTTSVERLSQLPRFKTERGPLASVEGEKRGIRLGFPHHRLIRDNHGCSRLYFVGDFLAKFWAEM